MKFELRPASRGGLFGRVVLYAGPGNGKTFTALATGFHLCKLYGYNPATDLAVLDTELVDSPDQRDSGMGSAEKYKGRPCNCNRCLRSGLRFDDFLTMPMQQGHRGPDAFMQALAVCREAGIKVVILDGITDEWRALLQLVDQLKSTNRREDPWATARPLHARFVQAILHYPGHVIATVRAKKENRHKKADDEAADVIPDQDSNLLYEFDLALFVKKGNGYVVKTRDDRLENVSFQHPGADLAEAIKAWCDDPSNPGRNEDGSAKRTPRSEERFAQARQFEGESDHEFARRANDHVAGVVREATQLADQIEKRTEQVATESRVRKSEAWKDLANKFGANDLKIRICWLADRANDVKTEGQIEHYMRAAGDDVVKLAKTLDWASGLLPDAPPFVEAPKASEQGSPFDEGFGDPMGEPAPVGARGFAPPE